MTHTKDKTYTCSICLESEEDTPTDMTDKGFWCEACDAFTYFSHIKERHSFKLILEGKGASAATSPKPSIKLSKQLSLYRYPGGKSKVIDYLYYHLQDHQTKRLISPFSGGASFELSMLHAGVVDSIHLNDLDFGVYALWWMVKNRPEQLIYRLRTETPTHDDYFVSQAVIKKHYEGQDLSDAAWHSLLVNRLAYSGVPKANPLGGRNGTQESLLSRWNPSSLIKKIKLLHQYSECITITNQDALIMIEDAYWGEGSTIFIDPPYVAKGKDLYNCFYQKDDHIQLASLLDSLHSGVPGADILVTYDYDQWLLDQYQYPEVEVLNRKYSV